jgi:hypothetical protein
MMRLVLLVISMGLLEGTIGCVRQQVPLSTPGGTVRNDNSYMDLEPGSVLRIVMPLLKPGAVGSGLAEREVNGNTITLSADDLAGYTTAHYSVTGNKRSGVRLRFLSAEETRNGNTIPMPQPPKLPFDLPQRTEHLRLIYLVRVSQADHNMAIVGSKRVDAVDAFTKRLREEPAICKTSGDIFCSWVPASIAVRPETR